MDQRFPESIPSDSRVLRCKPAVSSASPTSLLPWRAVTDKQPVFCGKCGTPNPADNPYCRKCGHHLADDVIEAGDLLDPAADAEPVSPVEGIPVTRFPLVDPETGEELASPRRPAQQQETDAPPPARRGTVILWSLGIHFVAACVMSLVTLVILGQLGEGPRPEAFAAFQELNERRVNGQISDEQAEREWETLLDRHGVSRILMILSGPVLLGFFISGFIAGRIWRPQRALDVGISGLVIGGLCSLCLISPFVWPLAFAASLAGTILGRRWR